MSNPQKILFAPLDWGLGHASRCIPLIQYTLMKGHTVIIAGNNLTNSFLQSEFPHLQFVKLRGYNIRYTRKANVLPLFMLLQIPKILFAMINEFFWLKKMIAKIQIDIVISDNRYGLHTKQIPCHFITHQTEIQIPQSNFLQKYANIINHYLIRQFKTCIIPDYEGENMGGILSLKGNLNHVRFFGNLSRLSLQIKTTFKYKLLVLLSGPEPQRTLIEESLFTALKKYPERSMLIRGLPLSTEKIISTELCQIVNYQTSTAIQSSILSSEIIICRSGYSTIMDLIKLKRHAILIPTPGQTEQEYLAKYLMKKKWFMSCPQDKFSLTEMIDQFTSFNFHEFPDWDMEKFHHEMNDLLPQKDNRP